MIANNNKGTDHHTFISQTECIQPRQKSHHSNISTSLFANRIVYGAVILLLFVAPLAEPYQPGHQWRSSNDDIGKIYDSATPNPTGSLSGPWIDEGSGSSTNVTGVVGRNSYLTCRVKNIGNQTVSWLRHGDTHLLTVGLFTFTLLDRFSAIHRSNSEDWVLEIRNTKLSDQGFYQCQVSTTPVRSRSIFLRVAEPITTIHGGLERHIKYGSQINLTCQVRFYPAKLKYVIWYRNEKSLMKNSRYHTSIIKSVPELTISRLLVNSADQSDAGNYACSSEAGYSNTTAIHVITGENRAGLQVNSSPSLFIGWKNKKELYRHGMLLKSMFGFILLYSILLFSEGSSTKFLAYVQSNINYNTKMPAICVNSNTEKITRARN